MITQIIPQIKFYWFYRKENIKCLYIAEDGRTKPEL